MKQIILSVFILSLWYVSAHAQGKRINLYGAYVFDDEVSAYDTYNYGFGGKIKGGFQYGAGLEFLPNEQMGIELRWVGQTTTAPINYYSAYYYSGTPLVVDVNLNYAMLSFTRYMRNEGQKVETFGGLDLGALFASIKNNDFGSSASSTKFAWGFRLGANIWASERVAVKLQAQLLSAVQSVGGSLYFGTGGSGAAVSSYSTMLQFSLGGGLVFKLGN